MSYIRTEVAAIIPLLVQGSGIDESVGDTLRCPWIGERHSQVDVFQSGIIKDKLFFFSFVIPCERRGKPHIFVIGLFDIHPVAVVFRGVLEVLPCLASQWRSHIRKHANEVNVSRVLNEVNVSRALNELYFSELYLLGANVVDTRIQSNPIWYAIKDNH